MFFVRSEEQNFCPCCGEILEVVGSRRRKYINESGKSTTLFIRRLQCTHCRKIHHELPDILVPYKRYGRKSIEAVLTEESTHTVAADEATLGRWKSWFKSLTDHILGCLRSLSIQHDKVSVEELSHLPISSLQRIWHFVGNAPGWLARVVRPLVNFNFWVQTRSAFMSV